MAKKSWHKTHVPTKWGVVVLAFLLVTVVVLIPVLSQSQDLRSRAYVDDRDSGGGALTPSPTPVRKVSTAEIYIETNPSNYAHRLQDELKLRLRLKPENSSITELKEVITYKTHEFSYVRFDANSKFSLKSAIADGRGSVILTIRAKNPVTAKNSGKVVDVGTIILKPKKATGATSINMQTRAIVSNLTTVSFYRQVGVIYLTINAPTPTPKRNFVQ